MDEQIYIEWTDVVLEFGFETQETMETNALGLEKAMCGTVQAALQLFMKMVQKLSKVGIQHQSKVDPCVFFVKEKNAIILIIATHVDYCAIVGKPHDI